MIVYIYSLLKQTKVISLLCNSLELFKEQPNNHYPPYNSDDHIITDTDFGQDVVVTKEGVRTKTREELILEGRTEFLNEGEYTSKGKIIAVPRPTDMFRPVWNSPKWVEGSTLEEQELHYRTLIISKTRELEDLKNAGFYSQKLADEIEYLKSKHMSITHELVKKEGDAEQYSNKSTKK